MPNLGKTEKGPAIDVAMAMLNAASDPEATKRRLAQIEHEKGELEQARERMRAERTAAGEAKNQAADAVKAAEELQAKAEGDRKALEAERAALAGQRSLLESELLGVAKLQNENKAKAKQLDAALAKAKSELAEALEQNKAAKAARVETDKVAKQTAIELNRVFKSATELNKSMDEFEKLLKEAKA